MIYLIGQLSVWLLLTAAFAALAGWAFAAERAAPVENARRRERENLLRDVLKLAGGEAGTDAIEVERETDAARRQLELRDGRIAELEHALENARDRADDAAGEAETLRRRIAEVEAEAAEAPSLAIAAEPVEAGEDDGALQAWRLRYFEQRVRYLENQARPQGPATLSATLAPEPEPPILEWRARDAEARADFLAQELRAAASPPPAAEESAPFAADADVDTLLRWRMLYLERRVAHLQKQTAKAPPQPALAIAAGPDPDRWKWRARYLEARVRHLEQRGAAAAPLVVSPPAESEAEAPPPPPRATRKPPVLAAARDGAPDDLTLIEGVDPLQQTTLNAIGVFHFDQIAAWTSENVAWVDQYLRLRGRIAEEEWVEQAADLAREGPAAARRATEDAL